MSRYTNGLRHQDNHHPFLELLNLHKGGKEYFLKTIIAADQFLASIGFLEGEPTAEEWLAAEEKRSAL